MRIAAVILAAGASRRLGRPKQLLSLHRQTLLERAVTAAQNSLCQHVCIVLGANAEACREKIASCKAKIIFNAAWEEGIASSIRCGLGAMMALHADLQGVILLPCDQTALSGELLNQLIQKALDHSMVASRYAGTIGIPAFFARSHFRELLALQGDEGARHLLKKPGAPVETVSFPGGGEDVDTEEQWRQAQLSFPNC